MLVILCFAGLVIVVAKKVVTSLELDLACAGYTWLASKEYFLLCMAGLRNIQQQINGSLLSAKLV